MGISVCVVERIPEDKGGAVAAIQTVVNTRMPVRNQSLDVVIPDLRPSGKTRREVSHRGRGQRYHVEDRLSRKLSADGDKSAASCLLSTRSPAKFSRFFVNHLSLSGIYTIEYW
jgi:hypothetical protein